MKPAAQPDAGIPRRDFLKGGSAAALVAVMGSGPLLGQPATAPDNEPKPNSKRLKLAVIGLGARGREILDELGRLPEAEVAAICDHHPATLRRSAAKSPDAAAVADYQIILADPTIRAIIVATGTHQHRAIALAALRAGKHVYCEAPLAHTSEDSLAIARAAKAEVGLVFQSGLQLRSDPQRQFLLPHLRNAALGKPVKARAQWHKKSSWRTPAPDPEREKEVNWRLNRTLSPGLAGEQGIHALDQAGWLFNLPPVAVTGYASTLLWGEDGREVPDTVEAIVEYAGGFRLHFQASLASSFESESELLHGSDATILLRDGRAWMFKEADSPLSGWEIYARKEKFHSEEGIVLKASGTKQLPSESAPPGAEAITALPPLHHALAAFLSNGIEADEAVADFKSSFPNADRAALATHLATINFRPAAGPAEGHAATVLALKANEAITKGSRLELKQEMFALV